MPTVQHFITEDEIDTAMTGGSSFAGGKSRIYAFFMANHTDKEKVRFLKDEYGIGGCLLYTSVMTVDLIQMIADKNNLHDVDTWMIFKWVFKSAAAILIVTNTCLLYTSLPLSAFFGLRGVVGNKGKF